MSEFQYKDGFSVTKEVKSDYNENGFVIIRNLLDKDEVKLLGESFLHDEKLQENTWNQKEHGSSEFSASISVWNHPGEDVSGMVCRSEKVVNIAEDLLDGGEIYMHHCKLVQKQAKTGGQWNWHQDYGYWYQNGLLWPDALTVFIAIDKCEKGNGCLQVIKRSHKCGRLDHKQVGDQQQADTERVGWILEKLPVQFVELEPGDALYFHSNILHTSGRNLSENRRWAFLMAYTLKSNSPVSKTYESHLNMHYTPLNKVPNTAIKECKILSSEKGKDYLSPSKNIATCKHYDVQN
ncbi:unnamed protein product [Owenia fusiformis]|uniref:Phytanoyl-CoA dioxygenase family protein n=1 Tax=Owenia fusiformis TaxID=6347 RepID=A0A8S4PFL8_OWEFU|nr:unnamed protein product [Owenia fusiformis]